MFIIEIKGRIVCNCGLNIDWRKKRAQVWLGLLPTEWGKGYGSETLRLLEKYAKSLSLERLRATVNGWNVHSKKMFERNG